MTNRDDFEIELGQSVRRHIERKDSPADDRALVTAPHGSPHEEQIPVFIAESATRAMERHTAGKIDSEVGGVLLGGFFRTEKGSFIEVTDSIEARAAQGTDVSLTFTHETWEQIHSDQATRAPDLQIVGWYHSHPGLGVFMSKSDEFIHSSFFADPWHVAIVVDPIYHNWGCFKWRDGAIDRASGFYVFAEKKNAKRVKDYTKNLDMSRQSAPPSASPGAARAGVAGKTAPLWAAIVLLLVIQVVMTVVALGRTRGPDYMKLAAESLRHSDYTGAEDSLRLELGRDPGHPSDESMETLSDLAAVRSDPVFRKLDEPGLDFVNLSVWEADKLAKRAAGVSTSETAGLVGDESKGKLLMAAGRSEVLQPALALYEAAAPTRAIRLERAKAARSAMLRQPRYRNMKQRELDRTWFGTSVKWIEGEVGREADLRHQTNKDHN